MDAQDRQQASDLLAPLTVAEFVRDHWEQRPVVIPGSRAKLERLGLASLDRAGFDHEVQRAAHEGRKGFEVGALHLDGVEVGRDRPFEYIEPSALAGELERGASIAIDNFGDAHLARLIAALKLQLRHAGEVRIDAVVSSPGEGFPLHIDRASVIVVQVFGRKRWRISDEPVLRWPSGTTAFTRTGEVAYRDHVPERWEELDELELPPLREIMLEPGDVLYIPAGTLHTTEALAEPSLSVSMLFSPLRTLDLFARVLAEQLGPEPAWRNVPNVAEPDGPSDGAREFLTARLAELRELVATLTPDDLAFDYEWQRRLADPGEATRERLTPAPLDERFELTPTTRLRRCPHAAISHLQGLGEDGEPWLTAFHLDRELSVGGEWATFLRTALAGAPFEAATAIQWSESGEPLAWDEVQEALHALLADGVLELAEG